MSSFEWRFAKQGYEWQTNYSVRMGDWAANQNGECLVPVTWDFSVYKPLECTGLFRNFASTPPTPEGIRAFANKYGHLGEGGGWLTMGGNKGPMDFTSDEERDQFEQSSKGQREEHDRQMDDLLIPQLFEEWQAAILDLKRAVAIWDRVRISGDANEIKMLGNLVDRQLTERRITACFEIAPRPSRQPALHLMPHTLGGAMWLQFAQAIDGNKVYRACATCRQYFELSPKLARTSRHYCSEACKSKAYRFRKEQARRLHAEGKTMRQIAKELKSDIDTIKKWIAEDKE